MTKITILPNSDLCPKGLTIDNVQKGKSICRILLENNIEIEHACELSCACTTCHIIIKEGYNSLNTPSETEEDLLDKAWGLTANSRLSCQTNVSDKDLLIEIPRYTINHAKEK